MAIGKGGFLVIFGVGLRFSNIPRKQIFAKMKIF